MLLEKTKNDIFMTATQMCFSSSVVVFFQVAVLIRDGDYLFFVVIKSIVMCAFFYLDRLHCL